MIIKYHNYKYLSHLIFPIIIAFILFYFTFAVSVKYFWVSMATTAIILSLISFLFSASTIFKEIKKDINQLFKVFFGGILTALILYFIFFAGHFIISTIIPLSKDNVLSVYKLKDTTSKYQIAILISFIIAPSEEIFWRGYLQKKLQKRFKFYGVIISTILYTLVHLVTFNYMLMLAALICGFFWGSLYYRFNSLGTIIISHIVWVNMVFILLPFI